MAIVVEEVLFIPSSDCQHEAQAHPTSDRLGLSQDPIANRNHFFQGISSELLSGGSCVWMCLGFVAAWCSSSFYLFLKP